MALGITAKAINVPNALLIINKGLRTDGKPPPGWFVKIFDALSSTASRPRRHPGNRARTRSGNFCPDAGLAARVAAFCHIAGFLAHTIVTIFMRLRAIIVFFRRGASQSRDCLYNRTYKIGRGAGDDHRHDEARFTPAVEGSVGP